MLFIGNLLGRIWGFFVVRPSMKKAINNAENSGDFDEYKKAMDSLDENVDDLLELQEQLKSQVAKQKAEQKK